MATPWTVAKIRMASIHSTILQSLSGVMCRFLVGRSDVSVDLLEGHSCGLGVS